MLKQVSVFAENKKGTMRKVTQILADADINILGSVTNDSAEYGIIRMVVDKPEEAVELLKKGSYLCRITDVIGVEVTDEPGNLNKLLTALEESYINVNYLYLSFNRVSGKPIMVLHCDDPYEVEVSLKMRGFELAEA